MKKTRLRRGKQLCRRTALRGGPPPKRKTPIGRGNPGRRRERRRRRFERAYESVARVLWTRGCGCVVTGCWRKNIEVTHVRSRAAGGTADETVAMCQRHHRLLHWLGTLTFERRFRLNLRDLAAQHTFRWRAASSERAVVPAAA